MNLLEWFKEKQRQPSSSSSKRRRCIGTYGKHVAVSSSSGEDSDGGGLGMLPPPVPTETGVGVGSSSADAVSPPEGRAQSPSPSGAMAMEEVINADAEEVESEEATPITVAAPTCGKRKAPMPKEPIGGSSSTDPLPQPKAGQTDTFTIVCRLDKVLADAAHPAVIADAAERAHAATRLASRLLTFHLLRCLDRGLPLPAFGCEKWSRKAWYAVTESTSNSGGSGKQPDAELLKTRDECMPGLVPVDSTKLSSVLEFEARRWSVTTSTNIYRHFSKRVSKHVRTVFRMEKADFDALTKPQKLARKARLTKMAFDLCSPPTNPLRSDASDHAFVAATRVEWKLDAFPWDGKPLAYHQKADKKEYVDTCRAHLLLPAMRCMLRRRELDDDGKGFALLPLRTRFVPCHAFFDAQALRSLLDVGNSEWRKARRREQEKERRKAAKEGVAPPKAERANRPKAEVAAEKRADLMALFDLECAGIHACKGKEFDCTFSSDGYAAHLNFSRTKAKALRPNEFPRRGIWTIDELRDRLATPPAAESIDKLKAPKDRMQKLCTPCGCCVSDATLGQPFENLICVGCDPGRNEPANMADPISRATLRMTAAGHKHATTPGNWKRTERDVRQSYHNGTLIRDKVTHDLATAYRAAYVDKPSHITTLESEIGQLASKHCSTLLGFKSYVSAVTEREPTLVAHYQQIHHRKLKFKGHIERQRFESEFIRDIKRTFDPRRTGKTLVIAWGAWGQIAGRPGTVGNRGRAPTIGVGLAKRIAREDGIVVMWTPEHMTTRMCFDCGGECERDRKAEERRRIDTGFRRHAKEIRGLKVCTGCKRHVNRDLNAAKNIAVNGMLLLAGRSPIAVHTPEEVELVQLENDMLGA